MNELEITEDCMENTGIKPEVIDEIQKIARNHGINKVILFGSRARGTYYRASDIDLAVSGGDVDGFSLDVREETSTLLQYDVVDLGQQLAPELADAISREGIILYEEV